MRNIKFEIEKPIDEACLKQILIEAIQELYKQDYYLILNEEDIPPIEDHHCSERSIVFRFAHYLQNILNRKNVLTNLVVDCEYNRNGYNIKTLPDADDRTSYPDLIVHHRGNNDGNFLVIEFKTWWNSNTGNDVKKIKGYLDKNWYYGYKYGLVLILDKDIKKVINQINCSLMKS